MWMTLVDDIDCLNSCPEPVKEAPGKRKKEMAKQKAVPEAKKQKVEGTEPTTSFNLFVGNLNFNKSSPELKMVSVIFLLKIILLLSMSELVYLGSLAMWILNLPKTWKKPWNSLV